MSGRARPCAVGVVVIMFLMVVDMVMLVVVFTLNVISVVMIVIPVSSCFFRDVRDEPRELVPPVLGREVLCLVRLVHAAEDDGEDEARHETLLQFERPRSRSQPLPDRDGPRGVTHDEGGNGDESAERGADNENVTHEY